MSTVIYTFHFRLHNYADYLSNVLKLSRSFETQLWNLLHVCWKYKINEFYFGTNTKSTNLRIPELAIFNQTTKIDIHKEKYFHSMCRSKLRSESMITLISFSSVAFCRVVVFSLCWLSGSGPDFPICMCLHLYGLNFSSHVSLQSDNLYKSDCSMSCCLLMILNIFVSSAKKYTTESTRFGKSFMNMTKSRYLWFSRCYLRPRWSFIVDRHLLFSITKKLSIHWKIGFSML